MVFSKFLGKMESEMQVFFRARAVVAPLHLVYSPFRRQVLSTKEVPARPPGLKAELGPAP